MKTEQAGISLTNRQLEVLRLLALGLKNEDIAEELFVSIHTVKAHVAALYEILQVSARVNLVTKALRLGIINLNELDDSGRFH